MCLSHSKCPFNRKLLSDTQLKCVLKFENNVPRTHMQLNVWSNFIGDCLAIGVWVWLKNGRVGVREREREIARRQNSIPNRAVPNGTDTNSFRHVYFAAVWLTQTHTRDKHTESDRMREGEIKRFNQNAEEKMKNVYLLECSVWQRNPTAFEKVSSKRKTCIETQSKAKRRAWWSEQARKELCLAF